MAETATEVVVQIGGEDVLAGRLWSHRRGAAESATFAYDPGFLARAGAYALGPALDLVAAPQQTAEGRKIFAAFSDSSPDRWGRRVIARNEQSARGQGGQRSLGEIDFLLGVRDDMRQGALRFRDPLTGAYLADGEGGVPPLLDLPDLLGAADKLERDEAGEEELRILLRGGSSLGGARPKANVLLADGTPAIAKFPSVDDEHDVIRWEAVALSLARSAGVTVSDWNLHLVDGKPVLLLDRFDRDAALRIGYVSAMTMLEATDGTHASYLDIAEVIEANSPAAGEDLRELWRRIAFSVLISNTDDHLRNHGFLRRSSAGWSLAPAFDLNPDPGPGIKRLSTSIDLDDDRASVDLLVGVCEYFRLDEGDARRVLGEVLEATGQWQAVAARTGLDRRSIERMARAFEHEQRARVTQLATGKFSKSRLKSVLTSEERRYTAPN